MHVFTMILYLFILKSIYRTISCGMIDKFKTERVVAWSREGTGLSARVSLNYS